MVGTKFRSSVTTKVLGLRFYKGPTNTGTHTGSLWTAGGTELARVVFTGETASGWQEARFATPVTISANATYIVSYTVPTGKYSVDTGYFLTTATTNNTLSAPATGTVNGNGVYRYTSAIRVPNQTYQGSNYWVDPIVQAATPPDATPPSMPGSFTASPSFTSVGLTWAASTDNVAVTGYEYSLDGATYTSTGSNATSYTVSGLATSTTYTILLRAFDAAGNRSDVATVTATTLTPNQSPTASFTATPTNLDVSVNASASTDPDGTVSSYDWNWGDSSSHGSGQTAAHTYAAAGTYTITLTITDNQGATASTTRQVTVTTPPTATEFRLWPSNPTPNVTDSSDGQPISLGTRFTVTTTVSALGVRFYKGTTNTGTHIGSLWNNSGTKLAEVTFTGETASGWQEARFASPVTLSPGIVYTTAYFSPTGSYPHNSAYFTSAVTSGPLTAPAATGQLGNGVYTYGASLARPTSTYNAANYWVDVIVSADVTPDTMPPSTPTSLAAVPGSTWVALTWAASTDNVAVDHYEIYRDGMSVGTSTSTSFTSSGLTASTTYSFTVRALDAADNASVQSSSVTATTLVSSSSAWPDATNTGYRNAPGFPGSLTAFTGGAIQSNTTYEYIEFPSGCYIGSSSNHPTNVTFVGCRFASNSLGDANVATYGDNVTFSYCSFEPSGTSTPPVAHTQGYQYAIDQRYDGKLTVDHCDFWGWANGIQFGFSSQAKPLSISDSWFHDAREDGGVDHTDAILENYGAGANYMTFRHNTIASVGNTNGLALQNSTGGGYDHVTIDNNYFAGFNYTVNLAGSAANMTNSTFTNNVLGSDFPIVYGPSYNSTWASGQEWSNNKYSIKPGTTWLNPDVDGRYWWPGDQFGTGNGNNPATFAAHTTDYDDGFTSGPRTITHGEELLMTDVGPWALQGVAKGSENLLTVPAAQFSDRLSNWPGTSHPRWIPNQPYVYNNDPSNHGGIVPAGGMTIDGSFVPAGTYVVQFCDLSNGQLVVEGDCNGAYPSFWGLIVRGCRWRSPSAYVGFLNENGMNSGGKFWINFCDMGGLGSQPADFCEIPIKISGVPTRTYRNYLSYCTTAIQTVGHPGTAVLENYIERLTTFNTNGPHINGLTFNGGDTCARVERNRIVVQTPEDNGSGKAVDQTDCISFFQDFGYYPGTGANDDGTVGYRVINNYVGGTGYCIYAGAGPQGSVSNMYVVGNKITTVSFPNGGTFGPIAATPPWGSNGNVNSNNTWADGPNAGSAAF